MGNNNKRQKQQFATKSRERATVKQIANKINTNKTIHVELPYDVHTRFRVKLFLNENPSMQSFFREVVQRLVADDPYLLQLLDDVVAEKKLKKRRELETSDVNSLYSIIQQEGAFATIDDDYDDDDDDNLTGG